LLVALKTPTACIDEASSWYAAILVAAVVIYPSAVEEAFDGYSSKDEHREYSNTSVECCIDAKREKLKENAQLAGRNE